ncbi:hypothetical protein GCM10028803_37620 [Larkinella knui]|uniref:DinB family protein n=1 Tax=Larkinella knui TaxID=2025310 RepID=A0A3P1CE52_9BACT|nr:DinB family protein [Larkinella knui]RRB11611.1 DinB family protein [Larkinella knui]
MQTDLIRQLWKTHQQALAGPLSKLSDDNRRNRLTPETASAGFIALHIAETMLTFSRPLFGTKIDFQPQTLRAEDEGKEIGIPYIRSLLGQAQEAVTTAIGETSEVQWNEVVHLPWGEVTRFQGLVFMMHHNSYHIGQLMQAMKKGKTN